MRIALGARSFLHGHPRVSGVIAPVVRPLLRRLPALQEDPALASLQRFANASGTVRFVQLGAHDGVSNDPLHEFVIARPDWRGVVVEPVPAHFDALRATYAALGDRVSCERAVVGAQSGAVAFYRLRDVAGMAPALRQVGSLSRDHVEQYVSRMSQPSAIVEERVASTTLPELLHRHGITAIDLLHMDIEGAEPIVLSQIEFDAPWAPRALLFEHDHMAPPDFVHWRAQLRSAGYALVHGRQDTWAQRR